jgi:hypothetical protein
MTMRTEDDLRAVYRALERHAPDADVVLRAVFDQPRGLARLLRASRWRIRRVNLALGAVAAAVAAVAVVLATAGGPAVRSGPVSAPSLRARLLAAISIAGGDILYAGKSPDAGGMWTWPGYPRPGQQVRVRVLGLGTNGVLGKDAEYIFTMPASHSATAGSRNPIDWGLITVTGTLIVVDHARHTWGEWERQNITLGLPINAAGIRSEIAQGQLHVVRHTTLRGRRAIELAITLRQSERANPLRVTRAELWVDAGTYLPMRQILQFSDGKQNLTNYAFLVPTPANLAKLRPDIPAGYKRTTLHPDQGKKK